MRDGQRLSWEAEDDLLVGHETRQPHRVDRDVALLPASRSGQRLLFGFAMGERLLAALRRQTARGGERGAGWGVDLAGVVHLDDLDRLEMRSGDFREVHHQHRADREVRRDNPAKTLVLAGGLELVDSVCGDAGGADDRRCPCRDGGERDVQGLGGLCEVDQHARPLLVQERGQIVAVAYAADVLDAGFALQRGHEHQADPAAVSRHTNPDGVSHHGCLPIYGEARAAPEGPTRIGSVIGC